MSGCLKPSNTLALKSVFRIQYKLDEQNKINSAVHCHYSNSPRPSMAAFLAVPGAGKRCRNGSTFLGALRMTLSGKVSS